MAIILWASGFQLCLYAQQVPKLSPKVMAVFNRPPMQLKEDDAPLLRLKKERFNAVLNEAKDRLDLYNRGLVRIPELIEVGKRLYRAEADLYDKPEEKAQVLQRQLDVYTDAEADLEKKVREGDWCRTLISINCDSTDCRLRSIFLRLETCKSSTNPQRDPRRNEPL